VSGGNAEADDVPIPKRDKWADQKRLTGIASVVILNLIRLMTGSQ